MPYMLHTNNQEGTSPNVLKRREQATRNAIKRADCYIDPYRTRFAENTSPPHMTIVFVDDPRDDYKVECPTCQWTHRTDTYPGDTCPTCNDKGWIPPEDVGPTEAPHATY